MVTLTFGLAIPLVAVGFHAAWTQLQRQQLLDAAHLPPPPGMVLVPPGDFTMGSDDPDADPDESPARRVFVPGFYIDRHEVTNERYREFRKDHEFPPGEGDLPVTGVLKSEAAACCQSFGKRLPTGAEWEKAARGTNGNIYPWGNVFDPARANVFAHGDTRRSGGKRPPGSFPGGTSPYGCEDMSGNVWEWVSDEWHDKGLPFLVPRGEARAILRGGAHAYGRLQARASYQGFEHPEATCNDVGFRCAMAAQER